MLRTWLLSFLLVDGWAAVQHRNSGDLNMAFEVQSSGNLVRRQGGDNGSHDEVEELVAKAEAARQQAMAAVAAPPASEVADDDSYRWQGLGGESERKNLTKDECVEAQSLYLGLKGELGPNFTEPDLLSCKERCKSVASCAHWSYATEAQLCFLQGAEAQRVSDRGMTSGFPGPCKAHGTAEAVDMSTWAPRKKGEHCLKLSASYSPLDMAETGRTWEVSYDQCQFRCLKTRDCAHFTYFLEDQGCHLQGNESRMIYVRGSIAGDASCSQEEKQKFEAYMQSLPRMDQNDVIPCEDSWASFIPSDLPGDDLQSPGDLQVDRETSCQALQQRGALGRGGAGCRHSAVVRDNCPVLCGVCGSPAESACVDGKKEEPPLFLLLNETLNCSSVKEACHLDEEVDSKCKASCGLCGASQALHREPTGSGGCNRRRSAGQCFTRRRRLF